MGIFDIFSKKEDSASVGAPYKIETHFNPMRLAARKNVSVDLVVDIGNTGGEEALCSLLVAVPKGLGVDSMGLNRKKEVTVGKIPVGGTARAVVTIYGSSATLPQEYVVGMVAYAHFRDYKHVLNSMKKTVSLRAV